MTGSFCKVTILGRLGDIPQFRTLNNLHNTKVADFSIATNEFYTDSKTGDKIKTTEWHRITAFSNLADLMQKYSSKGMLLCVEGKLKLNKWTDNNGQERSRTEIIATTIHLLGGSKHSEQEAGHKEQEIGGETQDELVVAKKTRVKQTTKSSKEDSFSSEEDDLLDFNDDVIPF